MANEEKKSVELTTFEPGSGPSSGGGVRFQSPEAQRKATAATSNYKQGRAGDVPAAEVNVPKEKESSVEVSSFDANKRVAITPRISIPRTSIGGQTYSFAAGKKVTVPQHVAVLLDEKGVLLAAYERLKNGKAER